MNESRDLFKKFINFSIGPVIAAFVGFISVPITTWLINPEEYGKSSMFVVFQQLSVLILLAGFDQSFVREYHESKNKNQLLLNSYVIPFLNAIIVFLILLFCYKPLSLFLFGEINFYSILILGSSLIFITFYRFSSLIIRMEERALLFSITFIMQNIVNLMFVIVLLYLNKKYTSLIIANLLSHIISSIIVLYLIRGYWKIKIDIINYSLIKKLFLYGFPLVFASIFMWIMNAMDKISLRIWSNFYELGVYANASKLSSILLIVQQGFATFWTPIAYRWYTNNVPKEKYNIVTRILLFSLLLIFFIILKLKFLLYYILEQSYYPAIDIFPFLLVGPILYTIGETTALGISFKRKTIFVTLATLSGSILNIIINYLLVPKYGAFGAVIANSTAFIFLFWGRTIISNILWQSSSLFILLIHNLILIGMLIEFHYTKDIHWLWGFIICIINIKYIKIIMKFFINDLSNIDKI